MDISATRTFEEQPCIFAVQATSFLKDSIDANRPVTYDWNLCNLYLKRTTFVDYSVEKPSDGIIPARRVPPGCDYSHIDLLRYLHNYGAQGWTIDQVTVDFDRSFRDEDAVPCRTLEIVTALGVDQLKKIKVCIELTKCRIVKMTAMGSQLRDLATESKIKKERINWKAVTVFFISGLLKKVNESDDLRYEIFHELIGVMINKDFRSFLEASFGDSIVFYLQTDDSQGTSLHEIYLLYQDKLREFRCSLPPKCKVRVVTHDAWLKLLHEGASNAPYYEG